MEALAERELQLSLKNDLETENQDDNDDFVDSDDSELNNGKCLNNKINRTENFL